ncbi:unnamed protein product [Effrenium voratum]|nr:unnamed protein product [Effrenium voratum]
MEPKSPWSTWSASTAATWDGSDYVATEKADITDTSDAENEPQRPAAAGDFGFKVRSDTWILNPDPEDVAMEPQQPGADTGLKVLTASDPKAKKKRCIHDPCSEVKRAQRLVRSPKGSVGKMMRVKTMRAGEGPDFYKVLWALRSTNAIDWEEWDYLMRSALEVILP